MKNSQGYALVSVLLIFTFLTLLAATLMAQILQSHNFVSLAEDNIKEKVTAENIAEKATALLEASLENVNIATDDSIESLLQTFSNSHNDSQLVYQKTKSQPSIYHVTISVPVGDGDKFFHKKVMISTIPELFRYVAVSPSDMTVNGAVQMEGDVYVERDMEVSNAAIYIDFIPVGIATFPSINGKLTVNQSFQANTYEPSGYFGIPRIVDVNRIQKPLEQSSNVQQFFTPNKPSLAAQNLKLQDEINISNTIKDKERQFSFTNFNIIKNNVTVNGNKSYPQSTAFKDLTIGENSHVTVNGDLYINDDLIMENHATLTVRGDIFINNEATKHTLTEQVKSCPWHEIICEIFGEYIISEKSYKYPNNEKDGPKTTLTGTVEVDEGNFIYIQDDFTINSLILNGAIYSNGQASIYQGIDTNGTIWVENGAHIQALSKIEDGTLIIMSGGNITLQFNNISGQTMEIDAFLYTTKKLTIYGILSNLQINGGIFGNPITLSAVKSGIIGGLSLVYKEDLILNPPTGIPIVNDIILHEIEEYFE